MKLNEASCEEGASSLPAQIGRAEVDDRHLGRLGIVEPLTADLIDLGVQLWFTDRSISDRQSRSSRLVVEVPVREIEIFARHEVLSALQSLLWHYTEDEWDIRFVKAPRGRRPTELQLGLPFGSPGQCEVALWSGGLDSFAGLACRICTGPSKHYVLVGSGASEPVLSLQRELRAALSFPTGFSSDLIQVPIRPKYAQRISKNRWQRARALTFQLVGAAVALHAGAEKLHIYENGVGAINLPFTAAEVGLDHARSVNPTSILLTQKLISLIIDRSFQIDNPFLFATKGEMCCALNYLNWHDHIAQTSSCDRKRRERPSQCGTCSSCLLRRQAIAVAGLDDLTRYVSDQMSANGSHLNAMKAQVVRLARALSAENTFERWRDFTWEFPGLGENADSISEAKHISRNHVIEQIIDLYSRYVAEWQLTGCFSAIARGA